MARSGSAYAKVGKPLLDRLLATILLLVWAPGMALLAVLVRRDVGPPVLFRQERIGKDKKSFELLKFRTMTSTADRSGDLLPDADRITRLGRIFRELSLDELPQLWNVVRGDMALVGPRPLYPKYMPYYTQREQRRHEVRPGMTGLAQIRGRNRLSWDERLELDVEYVETLTIGTDFSILLRTPYRVFSRRDVLDRPADPH